MAKPKTTDEMMADRNPLTRPKPVDIFAAPQKKQVEVTEEPTTPAQQKVQVQAQADPVVPYGTYLRKSQIVAVKMYAIEKGVHDKQVMQEAVRSLLQEDRKGFKAESYKGVPVAIEKHMDGSVTLCKEVVGNILDDTGVPEWVRELFK